MMKFFFLIAVVTAWLFRSALGHSLRRRAESKQLVANCNQCNKNADCSSAAPIDPGLFYCICSEAFQGDGIYVCADIDECVLDDSPCDVITGRGFCVDMHGSYKCGCLDEFEAVEGSDFGHGPTQCMDPTDRDKICGSASCSENQFCADGVCHCDSGYVQLESDQPCSADVDVSTTPSPNATTTGNTTSPCDVMQCDESNSYCNVEADGITAKCLCNSGYFQIGRGAACHDKDECALDDPCGDNAQCDNLDGGYICICLSGFEGNANTGCTDANECSNGHHRCNEESKTCVNTRGSFECVEFPSVTPSTSPSFRPSRAPTPAPLAWHQIGSDLEGLDRSSYDISMTGDGSIVAISGSTVSGGYVNVYKRKGATTWSQMGSTISSIFSADRTSVALARSDGHTLIVGDYRISADDGTNQSEGGAYVYKFDGSNWARTNTFFGDTANESFGAEVAISGDGSAVAVGSESIERVQVYDLDLSGGSTSRPVISTNKFPNASMRRSLAFSGDGSILAIGTDNPGSPDAGNPGNVIVMEWDGSTWKQLGNTFESGGSAVALSDDGSVLAIGATAIDGITPGVVKVYNWNDAGGGAWNQVGSDVIAMEQYALPYYGDAISLSADGSALVVGGNVLNTPGSGLAFVYDFIGRSWHQRGITLVSTDTNLGIAVDISSDGLTIASAGSSPASSSTKKGSVYEWRR
eukprot:CAMPEP_0119004210 /NCGR_PEP_ID=MMETSP1176-20130426/1015_1 /TAXON_ID=265551 /ORGANISM="Synedropsis recta cf, Strain CCMP1620" /LENGTH=694 /DNA_ID=CAMNT_0006955893 /DNA_START=37 /DNA_END=2121 /DNA_ORIENTATION=+